jgi:MarR family transcriptional regulator, 2-MHQ and catechol-resistance regulon repressor
MDDRPQEQGFMKKDSVISAPKLWTVLAKCYGSMAVFVEQSIAAEKLGLSDFMVLEALLHKGPLTMSAIGKKILLANASMTSAIDRLDERGLVVRKTDSADRRIRLIHLTARGKALILAIYDRHQQQLEELMANFSQIERAQLYRSLKKLGLTAADAFEITEKIS